MTLHVACTATGSYTPHAATMLKSLLLNMPDVPVCIYFLHDASFQRESRAGLERTLQGHNAQLRCIPAGAALPRAELPASGIFSEACWYRLLLPELLPELDRVLYLDCDLLVLDSLQALWETDLEGMPLGAITDAAPWAARWAEQLGVPAASYFNSGVLLMDLLRMRAEDTAAQIFEQARQHRAQLRYPDQDPLNLVLHARHKRLPLRYNLQIACYTEKPSRLNTAAVELHDALARPAVVHFNSAWKPWHYRCKHPLRRRYAEYRRQTAWPQFELEGRSFKNRILRLLPAEWASNLSQWRQRLRRA
ncbi:MAG: glycosyltransferase family 8 protein [Nevskiales bacterium]